MINLFKTIPFIMLLCLQQSVLAEDHAHPHGHEHEEAEHNHAIDDVEVYYKDNDEHQEHKEQRHTSEHGHHHDEGEEHHHEAHAQESASKEDNHKHEDPEHQYDDHEEHALKFSQAELDEFSVVLAQARSGVINKTLDLTGEVIIAPERLYRVVPGVSGVVRQIFKNLGDMVNKGDVLATLSSRDLADAKADYVAANSLLQLANASLKRERELFNNKITAKRKYLAAKQAQTEAAIKRNAAQQRLLAIGLTDKAIASVLRNTDKDLSLYELRAPASGVVFKKNLALGDALDTQSSSFAIADLSQVWVNLTVYQKDLAFIQQGQQVTINTRFGATEQISSSHISWISPVLDEMTRSATARVIVDNTKGQWRPGLFVSGKVSTSSSNAGIVIPLSALQTIDGQTLVFVQHEVGEFEPQAVKLGRRDHLQVEVLQGLTAGQTYVSKNPFVLKAQSQKSSFGHGHSH